MAEGAEGGLYVAHEFVDAPGVLAAGHSGIAAGDAFDEVHERFLDLARVVDRRRTFRAWEVVFEELEKAAAITPSLKARRSKDERESIFGRACARGNYSRSWKLKSNSSVSGFWFCLNP